MYFNYFTSFHKKKTSQQTIIFSVSYSIFGKLNFECIMCFHLQHILTNLDEEQDPEDHNENNYLNTNNNKSLRKAL